MAVHLHHTDVVVTKTGMDKKSANMMLKWELGVTASAKNKVCRANKIPFCDRQGKTVRHTLDASV
jgi:hypothetical protein